MIFKNGKIFVNGQFVNGGFVVREGIFQSVFEGDGADEKDEVTKDLNGSYVIPGLIDIHVHGAMGYDCSDADAEGIKEMAKFLASCGVTSFLPTTMTLPREQYFKIADCIDTLSDEKGQARIAGIRMEGPFLSEKKCGAQNPEYLQKADIQMFEELQKRCNGKIRIIDVAPEKEGALAFIRKAHENCVISLGHTDSDYAQAMAGFEAGASHVTHLFNGMRPLHHRDPALIGAVFDRKNATAEIIGDGIHIHESVLRTAFNELRGRICLISDGLRCMGVPDGEYELSGQKIICKDGVAKLENGTIAGAKSDLFSNVRNCIRFGIPKEEVITAATLTPSKVIGSDKTGAIEEGRLADFVICNEDFERLEVYIGGEKTV